MLRRDKHVSADALHLTSLWLELSLDPQRPRASRVQLGSIDYAAVLKEIHFYARGSRRQRDTSMYAGNRGTPVQRMRELSHHTKKQTATEVPNCHGGGFFPAVALTAQRRGRKHTFTCEGHGDRETHQCMRVTEACPCNACAN